MEFSCENYYVVYIFGGETEDNVQYVFIQTSHFYCLYFTWTTYCIF